MRLVDLVVTTVEGERKHFFLLATHHGEHAV